eukprot:TRINITY_DN4216_c0_g1_i1.p1 TRINITY_DN4216_c0_g1~~TRINITY_DN4216_c0_g1_i1.p1  ORF type:complete len:422 (+),score=137.02 TRINITY_DN4216_c0_g1_i1:53-1267(+)
MASAAMRRVLAASRGPAFRATVRARRGLADGPLPGELAEYSVVYHDRTLNHMSPKFVQCMQDISSMLKEAFNANTVAVIPGSGTYAMEAAARAFGTGEHCLVVRNGFFSFRWTQIFDAGMFAKSHEVINAEPADDDKARPAFAPPAVDKVVAAIRAQKPALVCCPHVETSAGIIVTNEYIKELAAATKEVGGLFLLDCIASGAVFPDMEALGIDLLVSAPQKGLAGPACAGMVLMNQRARERLDQVKGSSFAMGLKQWTSVMENYEKGVATYHATPPTDALMGVRDGFAQMKALGLTNASARQWELGKRMRGLFESKGYKSVSADQNAAPGILVCYCKPDCGCEGPCTIAGKFKKNGVQIAAGVPLKVGEPEPFKTFRMGYFGVDKLSDVDGYVNRLSQVLDKI